VANWSRDPQSDEDYEKSVAELKRALPRMEKLGTKMIRGMSFTRYRDITRYTPELEKMIFDKVTTLAKMCEDAGVMYMHENCANYGGMSSEHSLRLVENVKSPAFKLLFDTGNPANSLDHRKGYGKTMQDAFQFYSDVKEFVGYVHIKDGRFVELQDAEIFNKAQWTWPGEGDGKVKEIVADLLKSGYDGGFSIEPHMALVYHESDSTSAEEVKYNNYIEYGRRFMRLVEEVK
jgi:sugar phosphate isomerase/epimerase